MCNRNTILLLFNYIFLLFISCTNSNENKSADNSKDTGSAKKQNKAISNVEIKIEKPPVINIVDTVAPKRIVVYIKDSAATLDRISFKLGQIYGIKLAEIFKKNSLKIDGFPLAWYATQKAPFFFEAGIPVNKKPGKLSPGIMTRELEKDSVVVAHFYGPYTLIQMGYEALREWMKDHNRKGTGTPYEIYITDPLDKKSKPVDPYKVQTDIVFPRR